MEELLYTLYSVVIIAALAIAWLLATNYELRQNCKEWERNADNDHRSQLENIFSIAKENKKLREELAKYIRKRNSKGQFIKETDERECTTH